MSPLDRVIQKRNERLAREKQDSIRRTCILDQRNLPSFHAEQIFDQQRDQCTEEVRFIPYEVHYDYRSGCWVRPFTKGGVETRAPRRESAIPRQILIKGQKSRFWIVKSKSIQLWKIEAPNWYLARDEARRLADIAGYSARGLEIIESHG